MPESLNPLCGRVPNCKLGKEELVRALRLVLPTHGRTGLSHLFFGSVAEKVVRHAECPVLTLH